MAAATAVAAGLVTVVHRERPLVAALLVAMVGALGALSLVDLAEQRLPNRITVPLVVTSTGAVVVAGVVEGRVVDALAAIGLGALFAVVLLLLRFGLGDVKLAVSIGIVAGWLGSSAVLATVLVASGSGAATAAVVLAVHRRRDLSFGFGPCLALGAVAGMVVAGL